MDLKHAIQDVSQRIQRIEVLSAELADHLTPAEYQQAQAIVRELRRRTDDLNGILVRHLDDAE